MTQPTENRPCLSPQRKSQSRAKGDGAAEDLIPPTGSRTGSCKDGA